MKDLDEQGRLYKGGCGRSRLYKVKEGMGRLYKGGCGEVFTGRGFPDTIRLILRLVGWTC